MPTPAGAIPPTLPPSVEESYRRKCIQLRRRMNEVEEANEASRIRLQRMRRGIEKMRLERAFLLEQLTKRTSTNVEDSEGSPSPPPTPKEKPLRTKRGHRKPSFLNNLDALLPASSFTAQPSGAPPTLSPSNSDAFSHTQTSLPSAPPMRTFPVPNGNGSTAKSRASPPRPPRNPFETFVAEVRSVLLVANRQKIKEGTYDVEQEMARKWTEMPEDRKEKYHKKFADGDFEGYREAVDEDVRGFNKGDGGEGEDVEMAELDDEESEG